jgi:hypothetical protein
MTAHILPNEQDQVLDVSTDSPRKIDWIVRDDPRLEAELNDLAEAGEELSTKVVNKVLNCIKDL